MSSSAAAITDYSNHGDRIRQDPLEQVIARSVPLAKARELHSIYSEVFKSVQTRSDENWIEFLKNQNERAINRIGAPPIRLNFSPLIEYVTNVNHPPIVIEVVDRADANAVIKAAHAIDRLSMEGVGHSFGWEIYKKVLESKISMCFLAHSEENIVGCLLGTRIPLDPETTVFHVWTWIKGASHPYIRLVKEFQQYIEDKQIDFEADFLSLCVDEGNSTAKNRYENFGFEVQSAKYNKYTNERSFFMAKRLTQDKEKEVPLFDIVNDAIEHQTSQLFGIFEGLRLLGIYKINELFNQFRYK